MIHTHTISIGLIDWKMALIIKLYKLLQGLPVVATLEQINRTEAKGDNRYSYYIKRKTLNFIYLIFFSFQVIKLTKILIVVTINLT